jgi:hypothetical protein
MINIMRKINITIISWLFVNSAIASCLSEAKINIQSSNYNGKINIELREGSRPGSRVKGTSQINTSGTVRFRSVCPGKYFFAFMTPDSNEVMTTSYFDVIDDGMRYSMPEITVRYTRSLSDGSQTVGKIKKNQL